MPWMSTGCAMSLERKLTGRPSRLRLPRGIIDTQNHIYDARFAAHPEGPALPQGCPNVADYRTMARWLGIESSVVTVGNAHQTDNASLLAVLAELGQRSRGVAAFTPEMPERQINRLIDGGIVGARIMDLPGGAVRFEKLLAIDALTSPRELMIAVQFDGNTILEKAPWLHKVRSQYVIDHHAKFFQPVDPKGAEVDELKRLIDKGNCWFKLAGCYESSTVGAPRYDDVAAVAREISAYAPDRIVWGTNWPHNAATTTDAYPDDMDLMEVALSWIDPRHHRKVLVENPAILYHFPCPR